MSRSWKTFLLILLTVVVTAFGMFFLRYEVPGVQIAAEPIFHIGEVAITNTMLAAYLTTAVLALFFWAATRRTQVIPGRLQAGAELIIETFLGLCLNVAGERNGRRFFTLVTTIFLFVLVANWMGLVPGFGTIRVIETAAGHGVTEVVPTTGATGVGPEETVPLLRGATTDLNTTLVLALISVIATQVYGIQSLGAGRYLTKFFNFKEGPIGVFVGFLELISEFSRILSFSFRLFGNIFAGEVLLAVVGFLVPLVATLPFLGLELFVGVIQALIFAMLTLVFLTIATIGHGEHQEEAATSGH